MSKIGDRASIWTVVNSSVSGFMEIVLFIGIVSGGEGDGGGAAMILMRTGSGAGIMASSMSRSCCWDNDDWGASSNFTRDDSETGVGTSSTRFTVPLPSSLPVSLIWPIIMFAMNLAYATRVAAEKCWSIGLYTANCSGSIENRAGLSLFTRCRLELSLLFLRDACLDPIGSLVTDVFLTSSFQSFFCLLAPMTRAILANMFMALASSARIASFTAVSMTPIWKSFISRRSITFPFLPGTMAPPGCRFGVRIPFVLRTSRSSYRKEEKSCRISFTSSSFIPASPCFRFSSALTYRRTRSRVVWRYRLCAPRRCWIKHPQFYVNFSYMSSPSTNFLYCAYWRFLIPFQKMASYRPSCHNQDSSLQLSRWE